VISMSSYVPLWCKSNFSFLEGASHPRELVEACASLGITSMALTDRDGVYGIVEAHVRAREMGLRLITGAEVTLDDRSTIVLLASSRRGYASLCRLITIGQRRSEKGESHVTWWELCSHADGIIALWGGSRSLIVGAAEPLFVAQALCDAFGDRLYALLVRHRQARENPQERRLRRRAKKYGLPLVAGTETLYHHPSRRPLQDVLSCIRHRVKLTNAGRRIRPNAEYALRSPAAMTTLFANLPGALALTKEIADRCDFSLDQLRYRYPSEQLPDGTTSLQQLERLTIEGARKRYGGVIPNPVRQQVEKELALIDELDYCGYFLTIWEIVRFCRQRGILCQGRGSAANSAVCYCLKITAVDPVHMGLLFERFLSRERAEPPDIDLDIEHNRREEVIQHVYDTYGRDHAAMVATIVRYRPRSAVRDVGKVLGLAETALDRLSKLLPHYGEVPPELLAQAGFDPDQPAHGHLLNLANTILEFPRHLSIHPGGFLMGHEPVPTQVPVENATKPGRTVIQWDKESIEKLGLFKVDLLGLGALHHLHLGFDLLRKHYRRTDTMASLPKNDCATFDMICKGDTIGVFQIESRAQMAMLPRLRPRTYYDLVIEISIVRPGPITGGMVHPYLQRRQGREPVDYPHPSLKPVLEKTLGIPLFQEQVIRLAMIAADYTPGEADQLRRDMAAFRRSGSMDRHRERLVGRMTAKGIAPEFAGRIFDQIRGFGEYGFPESHAASFALIAYATAWMKCHFPEVFACALLNAQPMGFYAPATIIDDTKRHGVEIRPIDVQNSDWDCTLEPATDHAWAIRMGLRYVKTMEKRQWDQIRQARAVRPFTSVTDFVECTGINEGAASRLAEAGAFASLIRHRRNALWAVRGAFQAPRTALPLERKEKAPAFKQLTLFDTIDWDYHTSRHSTRGHPLTPLRPQLQRLGLLNAGSITQMPHNRPVRYAGMVICRQRPGTAGGVVFLTLEDESGFVNLIVWQRVYDRHALLIKTADILGVNGKLQRQDGVVHVIADTFWDPRGQLGVSPSGAPSRNFR
jgi:error-prone DNA polymerase